MCIQSVKDHKYFKLFLLKTGIPTKSNLCGGNYRRSVLKRTEKKLYNIAARTDTGHALSTEWASQDPAH
jgi:hypothetical protein